MNIHPKEDRTKTPQVFFDHNKQTYYHKCLLLAI